MRTMEELEYLNAENGNLKKRIKSLEEDAEIRCNTMCKLYERIKELEAQVPKWISVEERLPEDHELVIGLIVGTDVITADLTPELNESIRRTEPCYYVNDVEHDDVGWYSEGWPMVISPRMWMPLPEPPNTEESSAVKEG